MWPGHLGGSLCGGSGMDMKASSTIGFERANNAMLAEDDGRRFAARLIEDLGPQPPNFQRIVEINRGPLLREGVEGHPLAPRQVEQKRAEGALVVDVRTDLQFDDAHVPGAVCITMLRAGFGSKLAWIADAEQEIVFVGRDDADARRAVELAAAVGLDRIGGFLHGGMTSWREERRPVAHTGAHERPGVARPDGGGAWPAAGGRPRGVGVASRANPGFDPRALPRHAHAPGRRRSRSPGGRRLLVGPARRGRGEPAAAPRRQGVIHVVDGGVRTWRGARLGAGGTD